MKKLPPKLPCISSNSQDRIGVSKGKSILEGFKRNAKVGGNGSLVVVVVICALIVLGWSNVVTEILRLTQQKNNTNCLSGSNKTLILLCIAAVITYFINIIVIIIVVVVIIIIIIIIVVIVIVIVIIIIITIVIIIIIFQAKMDAWSRLELKWHELNSIGGFFSFHENNFSVHSLSRLIIYANTNSNPFKCDEAIAAITITALCYFHAIIIYLK